MKWLFSMCAVALLCVGCASPAASTTNSAAWRKEGTTPEQVTQDLAECRAKARESINMANYNPKMNMLLAQHLAASETDEYVRNRMISKGYSLIEKK